MSISLPVLLRDARPVICSRSRDDWFVLYAALQSKAYVLTSDILRKERGIANKATPAKNAQINDLLQKWLYRYQYMFVRQNNRVYFKVENITLWSFVASHRVSSIATDGVQIESPMRAEYLVNSVFHRKTDDIGSTA